MPPLNHSSTSQPRFSSTEFTSLIQDHLKELEARPDAMANHLVLLSVLRRELAILASVSGGDFDGTPDRQVA